MRPNMILTSALVVIGMTSSVAFAADSTLVWTGQAGDWKWETPENWSLGTGTSGDIATLLTQQTTYDLSALKGQSVTITSKNKIIFNGLKFPTCESGETPFCICLDGSAGSTAVELPGKKTFSIPANCTFVLRKKKNNTYKDAGNEIVLEGGGTFKIDAAFQTSSRTLEVGKGTTLELGENIPFDLVSLNGLSHTRIALASSTASLVLDKDMAVGLIKTIGEPTIQLNGHTLYLSSACMTDSASTHVTYSEWTSFIKNGCISFSGQHLTQMERCPEVKSVRVGNADCTWLYQSRQPVGAMLVVDGPGSMIFKGAVTSSAIAGAGVSGALRLAGDLTLTGEGETKTCFDARILGTGGLVKGGAGYSLTLTGVNGYSGATTVSEGELILKRENGDVPAPFAHWTFDDESNPGADSADSGMTLSLRDVATIADVPFANGKALCIQGGVGCACFDPKERGAFPGRFPTGKASFSVSCRFRQTSAGGQYGCLVGWGDQNTVQRFFMLEKQGDPRKLVVNWNTTANWGQAMSADESMDYTPMEHGAEWTHAVVTVDRENGEARLYTDGRLVSSSTELTDLDIDPSGILSIGWRETEPTVKLEAYVDDVQIFDRVLDAQEVKQVVRALATGSVGPVLPATSPVTVAEGATFRVEGMGHEIASLAGAGALDVATNSSIAVKGAETFAGVVTGTGAIRTIAGASPVFSGDGSGFAGTIEYAGGHATFASSFDDVDRSFAEDATLTRDELPAVSAPGRMRLPSVLTLDLGAVVPLNQTLVLAEAGCFVTPEGKAPDDRFLKNWKWTPEGEDYKVKYFIKDGKLCAFVGKPGLLLLFR